jgi:hypothetical protein
MDCLCDHMDHTDSWSSRITQLVFFGFGNEI